MNKIWYEKPARHWREALPLGNGKTGVMIYGSAKKERLCFNDGTLWSGYPKDYNSAESFENLNKVRKLIFEGKNNEADTLCEDKLKGFYSETFMPLGEVTLKFSKTSSDGFVRSLNLENAVHTVNTQSFYSEAFASYPDKITVYRAKSISPFNVTVRAKSKLKSEIIIDNSLNLIGNAPDYAAPNYLRTQIKPIRYDEHKGMAFCLRTEIETNGILVYRKNSITVKNATALTLYFATATGFNGYNKMPDTSRKNVTEKCIKALNSVEKNFEKLKKSHIKDFSSIYSKQSVSFGKKENVSTDKLIKKVKGGADETALCELLYNYGKYMIVSGSRNGGQALNLQGIWNNIVRPPWSSNYTVNINTEMNYWGASRAGLSECIEPLINLVYEVMQTGRATAKINYGCRGFACNHNVDIWRKTPPVQGDANYMFAPLCGVWLVNEVYAHYKNGGLDEYETKINEIVTEAARFANDFLILHNGYYVTCPSASPENVFFNNSKKCKLDYASAFDMGIVRQIFKNASEISEDVELLKQINEKLPLLYPFKNGENGICEWHDEFDVPEKGHRHFSPLYAFYPGNIIGFYSDKELTDQVRKLFSYRLSNSGQHIGWSAAWAMCISGKLRDSKTAKRVIRDLLCKAVFTNLFCVHPPFYFQIDGNLGFVAGINELLLTEENGAVELLPALTETMNQFGKVNNMVINAAKVSFEWKNGVIENIVSDKPIKVINKNIAENCRINENVTIIKEH